MILINYTKCHKQRIRYHVSLAHLNILASHKMNLEFYSRDLGDTSAVLVDMALANLAVMDMVADVDTDTDSSKRLEFKI